MTIEEIGNYTVILQKLPMVDNSSGKHMATIEMGRQDDGFDFGFGTTDHTRTSQDLVSPSLQMNGRKSSPPPKQLPNGTTKSTVTTYHTNGEKGLNEGLVNLLHGIPNGSPPPPSRKPPSPPPPTRQPPPPPAPVSAPTSGVTTSGTRVTSGDHSAEQRSSQHLTAPVMPNASPKRYSSPPILPSSPQGGSNTQGPPGSQLRHRHTLQVPKTTLRQTPVHTSAGILATQSDEIVAVSSALAPRRASISLGRRPTRSIHSDVHLDEIPQDEDSQKWADAIRAKRMSKRKKKEEEVEDEVLVGTKVDIHHTNYVTMYNMLTGIRFVVSRCNAKMDRPLTDADFDAAHKFSFDIMGSELTPSAKYDFKFKDYAPWVFRHLRSAFNIDPGDYLMSLTHRYILSELGSPGKSGSFFYFSRDYKYIIKTIHHAEHRYLRKILREYYAHVTKYPNTLISRFFGLHRVKIPFGRKIHFVIMNNIFPPHKDIHMTFDLKGSHIGREYKEEDLEQNPRAVLKDLNWERRNMHLCFGPNKHREFLEQAQVDVALLQRLRIMDYSLLVGIHDVNRGNTDNIREKNLQVFQPGGSSNEETGPYTLARTPSRLETARKRAEMRKLINSEVPISFEQSDGGLPEEISAGRSDQARSAFNRDEHGYRATDEADEAGEVIYYLGIIDCLTKYDLIKRFEHFWKGLSQDKHEISAVPPTPYGDRFFRFISNIIQAANAEDRGIPIPGPVLAASAEGPDDKAEANHPDRILSTVRSPSTEQRPSQTILPVVEEVGEGGSSGARSRSRSDSPENFHQARNEVPDATHRPNAIAI